MTCAMALQSTVLVAGFGTSKLATFPSGNLLLLFLLGLSPFPTSLTLSQHRPPHTPHVHAQARRASTVRISRHLARGELFALFPCVLAACAFPEVDLAHLADPISPAMFFSENFRRGRSSGHVRKYSCRA